MKNHNARPNCFVKAFAVAAIAGIALTGCSSTMAKTDARTIELENGGTVECVLSGTTSGTADIYCIDASYIPPTSSK